MTFTRPMLGVPGPMSLDDLAYVVGEDAHPDGCDCPECPDPYECSYCGGSGGGDEATTRCPWCRGTGTRRHRHADDDRDWDAEAEYRREIARERAEREAT